MAIIISKNGKNAIKLNKSDIPKEDFLQEYIHENPECIPLYDYKEDVRLLILVREFPSGSGPIDAIGIDKDGELYIVETKLYKNSDKRLVVAQLLDYGAALCNLYSNVESFIKRLDALMHDRSNIHLSDKIKEFYDIDEEEYSTLIDNMKMNIVEGKLKFVVLMDKLEGRLKNLISFINDHSNFSIFAVEVEYYRHDDHEIVIPKLFGEEAKGERTGGSDRTKWDEEKYFEQVKAEIKDPTTYKILDNIYNFTKSNSDKLDWGTGTESGSFTFKLQNPKEGSDYISIFTVWTSGTIRFRFQNIRTRVGDDAAELFKNKLSILPVTKKWKQKDIIKYGPADPIREAFPSDDILKSFMKAIIEFKEELKNIKVNS